ncbi:MAG: hypothetical protein ACJAUP_002640 [Cellvibrionaceae bacterium]|jgi:hypothetical protein
MQKIYTAQTLLAVTHVKNLLEFGNINAELRNEYAAGGIGDLSFVDAWPELWVNYEDVLLAKEIVSDFQGSANPQEWQCSCGESNGAAFGSCWSCGIDKST